MSAHKMRELSKKFDDFVEKVYVIESERDALQTELTRLSGQTGFCVLCEGYAKEAIKLKAEVANLQGRVENMAKYGMTETNKKEFDRWKSLAGELAEALRVELEATVGSIGGLAIDRRNRINTALASYDSATKEAR